MPWVACASDGRIELPGGDPLIHPRRYGNFAHRLRHYALDRGVVSLECAIHSATGLPAQILGLRDRGLLRPGFAADVVVLDPDRVRDAATFEDPHRYSEGIDYVLVNGIPVVDEGKPTWNLPGHVLAGPGTVEPRPSPPAARYVRFSSLPAGSRAPGWTPTWHNGRWQIAGPPGLLRQQFTATGRRVLAWDEIGTVVGDVEIFAPVRGSSPRTLFIAALHVAGEHGLESAYTADVRSGRLRVNRYGYGKHKVLGAVSFEAPEDGWINILLSRNDAELRAKAWTDVGSEPEWMISVTDHTLDSWAVGIGGVDAGSVAEWECVGVSLGGLAAPRDDGAK